jgi:hypothetical protein
METKTNNAAPRKIVEIIEVTDTREFEEVDDRWVPVAGSGEERECDRCGRIHVVHAHVKLSDGTHAIVGTGCMLADEAVVASRIRSAARRATTLRKLRAELVTLEAKQAAFDTAREEVYALPVPEMVRRPRRSDPTEEALAIDDVEVYLHRWSNLDERRETLTHAWRQRQIRERGVREALGLDRLRDRIARLEKASK